MSTNPNILELVQPQEVDLQVTAEGLAPCRFGQNETMADSRYLVLDDGPISCTKYADVYRAQDQEEGQEVAVKVLKELNEAARFGVNRELNAHIVLNGLAGLVRTTDMGIVREPPMPHRYVTTIFEDGTLAQSIREQTDDVKRINILVDMAEQILPAVASIHEKGLIHNDIKPGNILRCKNRGKWALTDFGLIGATLEGLESAPEEQVEIWEPKNTLPRSQVIGTPGYIAPELLEGEITKKVDVFSMGATMFYTSTGKLPFPAASSLREYVEKVKIAKESPASVESINRAVPLWLSDLTMGCLEINPANRPTDEELISEFMSH